MDNCAGASQSLPDTTSLPTARHFSSAIIDILGRQTDYRAGVGIKASLDGMIKPVLRHVGIDPDTHPKVVSGQWPLAGDPDKRDLQRKISFAFRNQRKKYCGHRVPLTIQVKSKVWALTEAGVEEAICIRREQDPGWAPTWQSNATATWLGEHQDGLIEEMVALGQHFGGYTTGDIETFLRRLREQDGLQATLASGGFPSALSLLDQMKPIDPALLAMPKPSPLFDAVIDVLCEATGFRASHGITPNAALVHDILLKVGIDSTTHPLVVMGHWPLTGKPSLTRKVQHAFKWQADTRKGSCCGTKLTDDTCATCGAEPPLAHSSSRRFTTFLRAPGQRPQWALTTSGAEHGLIRRCGGEKLTPFWLAQHEVSLVDMVAVLRKTNRRLSQEKAQELCLAFLDDLTEGDGLRELLLAGASPTVETVHQMCCTYAEARWCDRNATTAWLAEDVDQILSTIRKQLGGSLAKSRNIGEIDDLAHTYLTDVMRNDTLATRLEEGRAPSKWTLASWARRRAYSKFRDAGRDAHSRAFREATTAVERTQGEEEDDAAKLHEAIVEISMPSNARPIHLVTNTEGRQDFMAGSTGSSSPLVDVMKDLDPEERLIGALDRERGLRRLEACMKAHKKGAPERYWGVFKYVAHDDLSTKEIAEREGVQRNRAASLTQDMRTALRESATDSGLALDILQYVEEEPYATERDLHEDLDLDYTVVVRVLGGLKDSGWLEAAFNDAADTAEGSYTITRRGSAYIREQADPELRSDLMSRLVV